MQYDMRVRASSASRHRSRPSPDGRLPTAAQPHTLHWRASGARDGQPRPKVVAAWEFTSDPRAAQVAAISARPPTYGASNLALHSCGRAAAASRPASSAAVLRPSQAAACRSGASSAAATKPHGGYYAASAAALAATASAASHASAASTTRVGPYTAGSVRPASAAVARTAQGGEMPPAGLLRPASASHRFGAATGASGGAATGGAGAHGAHPPRAPYAAYVQPPPLSQRPAAREAEDGSAGVHARRALSQPAWSPAELQQRSQYAGTIADDVLRHYSFGRQLGSGSFGEVREATHRLTESAVAVKKIDKLKASTVRLRTRIAMEIRLHPRLRHPNIVPVYEVIEGARNVYMVMEAMPTTLLALLKEKKALSEAEARPLFAQLLAAVGHCHAHSIVHRDIKLENLLIDERRGGGQRLLKLCDFGFAVTTRAHKLTVACGSPSYNCPEIVARRQYHGVPADVWSSGVLLFVVLVGSFPFTGSTHESLNRRILAGSYRMPPELSASAQDLIRRCLQVDPSRRASVAEMADHPWMREGGPIPRLQPKAELTEQEVQSALESLGLGRPDARLAYEQLRRGERTHVTTAYELLAARRRQHPAAAAGAASARGGSAAAQGAVGAAAPGAHSAGSSSARRAGTLGAVEVAAMPCASHSGAQQQPAPLPLGGAGGGEVPLVGALRAPAAQHAQGLGLACGGESAQSTQRTATAPAPMAAPRGAAPACAVPTHRLTAHVPAAAW